MERTTICPYLKSFIISQFLHDSKGPGFCCYVMVIDSMQEMMASSVISELTNVAVELSAIAKIRKYK